MEQYTLDHDIKLLCIPAANFPEGVAAAHRKLHSLLPLTERRTTFGISWPDGKGSLVYKAGAEEAYPGETEKLGGETFIVRKGKYISIMIHDYMSNIPAFGKAFKELCSDPRIDPHGAAVEMYLNDREVRCMVRLNNN
ncbi:MAG TPA: hypothetical protein VI233_01095 [Puia sp.]